MTFGLFGLKIHAAVAVIHPALALDRAAREQQGLGKRGFAAVAMAKNDDIPDLLHVLHKSLRIW